MYLEHWQLDDFPFENVASPRYFFASKTHHMLYEDLEDAIHRCKGAIALTGDIGCGKSTITQHLLLNLPEDRFDIALITHARLTPAEMLLEIARQLGLDTESADKNLLLRLIQEHLAGNAENGRNTLVCIDEAQSIPSLDTFEELRLLLNFQLGDRFLITLFFVGQPELRQKIAQLPQLQQRIALHLHLGHMDEENTTRYILHRLRAANCQRPILTRQAAQTIHRLTGGIPRRVNHLMDRCLLVGMRKNASLLDRRLVSETAQRYPC